VRGRATVRLEPRSRIGKQLATVEAEAIAGARGGALHDATVVAPGLLGQPHRRPAIQTRFNDAGLGGPHSEVDASPPGQFGADFRRCVDFSRLWSHSRYEVEGPTIPILTASAFKGINATRTAVSQAVSCQAVSCGLEATFEPLEHVEDGLREAAGVHGG